MTVEAPEAPQVERVDDKQPSPREPVTLGPEECGLLAQLLIRSEVNALLLGPNEKILAAIIQKKVSGGN